MWGLTARQGWVWTETQCSSAHEHCHCAKRKENQGNKLGNIESIWVQLSANERNERFHIQNWLWSKSVEVMSSHFTFFSQTDKSKWTLMHHYKPREDFQPSNRDNVESGIKRIAAALKPVCMMATVKTTHQYVPSNMMMQKAERHTGCCHSNRKVAGEHSSGKWSDGWELWLAYRGDAVQWQVNKHTV